MPTKESEPHENLVLFEDDLYRAFFHLARDFSTWINEASEPKHEESAIALSTIGGAALLVEELLNQEEKDGTD